MDHAQGAELGIKGFYKVEAMDFENLDGSTEGDEKQAEVEGQGEEEE